MVRSYRLLRGLRLSRLLRGLLRRDHILSLLCLSVVLLLLLLLLSLGNLRLLHPFCLHANIVS